MTCVNWVSDVLHVRRSFACSLAHAWPSSVQVVANLRQQRDEVREKHRRLLQAHHERFHKVWGQLMKTGYQNSRFAHQVWTRCTGMMFNISIDCKPAMMHVLEAVIGVCVCTAGTVCMRVHESRQQPILLLSRQDVQVSAHTVHAR